MRNKYKEPAAHLYTLTLTRGLYEVECFVTLRKEETGWRVLTSINEVVVNEDLCATWGNAVVVAQAVIYSIMTGGGYRWWAKK